MRTKCSSGATWGDLVSSRFHMTVNNIIQRTGLTLPVSTSYIQPLTLTESGIALLPFKKVTSSLTPCSRFPNGRKSSPSNSASPSAPRFCATTPWASWLLNVNIPHPVCLINTISVVPSSCSEMTSERKASLALPPAFRITCASPSEIPKAEAGSIRASIQVTARISSDTDFPWKPWTTYRQRTSSQEADPNVRLWNWPHILGSCSPGSLGSESPCFLSQSNPESLASCLGLGPCEVWRKEQSEGLQWSLHLSPPYLNAGSTIETWLGSSTPLKTNDQLASHISRRHEGFRASYSYDYLLEELHWSKVAHKTRRGQWGWLVRL